MPKLVVLTGSLAGLSLELSANWTTIGRAEGNTFQIADTSISGRHCEILLRGEDVLVGDLNSTNGTFIKGERVTKAILRPGQILRLGQVDLRLEASTPAVVPTSGVPLPSRSSSAPAAPATVKPGAPSESGDRPAKKHQVLFVDDDRAFLEAITALYEILGDKTWEIHRATTADQALDAMRQKAIDLVVLDIGMPVLDGMQLLTLIHRRYPDVKKAILTGSASTGDRAAGLANGAELFIQKPLSGEGMKAVFTTLNELITWAQRKGFSGMLRQVGLSDVIQMECIGRNSSILEVRNQRMHGQIYIETGAIVHATAGALTGEKAFCRLLSLTGGVFRLQPFKPPPERTVHGRWELLVMEAARVHDEEATTLITRSDVAGQTSPATPSPVAPGTEFHAVGENVVEMAGHDGKWHPVDGSKETP
jgi:CheY-like chemotaxis protein